MGIINKIDDITGDEYELSHVPDDERKSTLTMVAVYAGFTIAPSTLVYGGELGGRLTATEFIITQGIGFLAAAIISIIVGMMAMKYGLTFHLTSRYFFGSVGAKLPSLALTLTRVGWAAVSLALIADMFATIFTGLPFWLATIGFGIVISCTALFGYEALKYISYISIPLVFLIFIYGISRLNITFTGGAVDEPMSFTAAVGSGFAYWLGAAVVSGDWLRYSRSKTTVVISTLVSILGVSMLLGLLGFFTVFATQEPDITQAMVSAGIIIPATIALFALVWTSVDNNLYSASLGFSNILEIRKIIGVAIASIAIVIIAGFRFHEMIIPFVSLIGVFIGPVAAIWIAEYYVFGNTMSGVSIEDIGYDMNWAALIAWLIGSGVANFTPEVYVVPLVSMLVTLLAYVGLAYLLRGTSFYPVDTTAGSGARLADD